MKNFQIYKIFICKIKTAALVLQEVCTLSNLLNLFSSQHLQFLQHPYFFPLPDAAPLSVTYSCVSTLSSLAWQILMQLSPVFSSSPVNPLTACQRATQSHADWSHLKFMAMILTWALTLTSNSTTFPYLMFLPLSISYFILSLQIPSSHSPILTSS